MSRLLLTAFFVLIPSFVQAYAGDDRKSTDNLYERAVSACVTKQLEDYGRQNEETRLRLTRRLFLKDQILTAKLPIEFSEIKVQYVGSDELLALYREKKKRRNKGDQDGIPFTIIRPMRNEGETLIVSLSDYWFRYENKSYSHGLEGGCNAYFNFESGSGRLNLTKTDLWGV